MDKSDIGLTYLPIADSEYKDRSERIKDSVQVEKKFKTWASLKKRIETGGRSNYNWACKYPQNANPPSLYGRIRCGFNAPPDVALSYLSSSFEVNASGWMYTSKLQYSLVTWVGYIPYYSTMADPDAIAKQLMMMFDYRIPLAVETAWPSSIATEQCSNMALWRQSTIFPHGDTNSFHEIS